MRVIARREPPHPGAQLRITDADGMRITAFATNTTRGQLADLELRHRRRARAEDRIRYAKDTGTPDDASVPPDVLAALREIQRLVGVVVPSLITEVETGAKHAAVIATIPLNATGSGCAVTANNFAGLTNTFWTSLTPEQIATIRQWRARAEGGGATAVVGVATADHIDRFEGLLAFMERIIPLNN